MSSEPDFKKLSTSSGGGYKPLQEVEDKLSEVKSETSKERALRQRLERQAELKYTEEDYTRWRKVIAECCGRAIFRYRGY